MGALIIGKILAETELPAFAFSVLPCDVKDAGPLTEDPRVALVSFMRSDVVGKKLITLGATRRLWSTRASSASSSAGARSRAKLRERATDIRARGVYEELPPKLVAKVKSLLLCE